MKGPKLPLMVPLLVTPSDHGLFALTRTSQKGLNEDSTLGFELAVEVAKDGPDHAKHNLEVCLLQCRLTGGVQQVLQLRDQQLAHPHQQRMLKGWYGPAGLPASLPKDTASSLFCVIIHACKAASVERCVVLQCLPTS